MAGSLSFVESHVLESLPRPSRSHQEHEMPESGIGTMAFDVANLRSRLRTMNDAQLLRFVQAAKYMYSPRANLGKPPRWEFVIQLEEARKEWKRRNPNLPLADSI